MRMHLCNGESKSVARIAIRSSAIERVSRVLVRDDESHVMCCGAGTACTQVPGYLESLMGLMTDVNICQNATAL